MAELTDACANCGAMGCSRCDTLGHFEADHDERLTCNSLGGQA